eukprot:TRINITY_DN4899_c0_g1_i2.p1 TRINITY_DN4899_c0_g1~~TRINITY_DN4899_c0_g1_i2.p1  ORF type:complete len:581 (-),score=52.48 TRINITY_DN4899_c0_g1_i2:182-1924(-)
MSCTPSDLCHHAAASQTTTLARTHCLRCMSPGWKKISTHLSSAAKQQKVIVDDVLDLSKIDANKIELNPGPFCLQKTFNSIAYMYRPQIDQKQLNLQLDLPPNNAWLYADDVRLRQVVSNLLGNAIKFTSNGGTITLRASHANDRLSMVVEDSGIGMTDEEVSQIFVPFKQANKKISGQYGGSGLGLVISKKLADMMGGNIDVQSQKHSGSCFTVEIQCRAATTQEIATVQKWSSISTVSSGSSSPSSSPGNSPPPSPSSVQKKLNNTNTNTNSKPTTEKTNEESRTILIVEDSLLNQKILARCLELKGYCYQIANNGLEAVCKTDMFHFDLVFMDIEMPIMGGFEATKRIREKEAIQGRRTPIIGCSGNARAQQKDDAIQAGMDGYLTKPYHREEIYQAIDSNLRSTKSKSKSNSKRNARPSSSEQNVSTAQKTERFSTSKSILFTLGQQSPRTHLEDTNSLSPSTDQLLWRAVLDQANEAIIVVDAQLTYRVLNRACKGICTKLFGMRIDEGMNALEVPSGQLGAQYADLWKRALLGEILSTIRTASHRSSKRCFELNFSSLSHTDGLVGALCLVKII